MCIFTTFNPSKIKTWAFRTQRRVVLVWFCFWSVFFSSQRFCLPVSPLWDTNWVLSLVTCINCLKVVMLLLLLSRFSRVQLCATPQTAAQQAPLSLGFSRQEHWSGLPFPSPMQENEKWKWSRSVVSDSSWPHGLQPTRLLHPWGFPGKSTGVGVPLPSLESCHT